MSEIVDWRGRAAGLGFRNQAFIGGRFAPAEALPSRAGGWRWAGDGDVVGGVAVRPDPVRSWQ